MTEISREVKQAILARIMADLAPSKTAIYSKTGFSVMLGGLISLFLCGQLGLGLSPFAISVNHALHAKIGIIACSLVCGSIFALFPMLTLRLLCHPLQFRAIVFRHFHAILTWLAVFGLMLFFNNASRDVKELLAWFVGSSIIFTLAGIVLFRIEMLLWKVLKTKAAL